MTWTDKYQDAKLTDLYFHDNWSSQLFVVLYKDDFLWLE